MDKIAGKKAAKYWLAAAFAIGFLAVGLPYWQIPYAKVSLPNTLYGSGFLVFCIVGATVPLAVLARVAVETNKDPTSHNLWPFEFIMATAVGALCSFTGALLGNLPALFAKHKDEA